MYSCSKLRPNRLEAIENVNPAWNHVVNNVPLLRNPHGNPIELLTGSPRSILRDIFQIRRGECESIPVIHDRFKGGFVRACTHFYDCSGIRGGCAYILPGATRHNG